MIPLISILILVQSVFSSEEPNELPVESFIQVDPSEFNETIIEAAIAGETWPGDQICVAVKFLGGVEARFISITKVDNRGECADTSIVTVIQDGFLDDSMRGQWDMIFLYLNESSNWIIFESRRAWRCWRGVYQIESFGSSMCP
jgi:hypothetical protein